MSVMFVIGACESTVIARIRSHG